MSEMSRDELLRVVREVYAERDPVPDGLVQRMRAAAGVAAAALGADLDLELMLLVEGAGSGAGELAGTRGATAYTLRFVHGDTDLLLRIAPEEAGGSGGSGGSGTARVDGWIVPAETMTVRILREGTPGAGSGSAPVGSTPAVVSESGRFELTGLASGLLRLRFEPHDGTRPAYATPTFEI